MLRALPLLLVLAGCAASPLYVERSELRGTRGEVPRDVRGEPLWAAIKPMPEGAVAAARGPVQDRQALASRP
jgi:hypothetical protein